MMRFLVLIAFVFSLETLNAQKYFTNTYFDSTIIGDFYNSADCTGPLVGGSIFLDTSVYNYVAGLRFVAVFDSINGTVSNTSGGQIYTGDTFLLNSSRPGVSFILTGNSTTCSYHVQLSGTPSEVNQSYPCKLQFNVCTCFCPQNILITRDTSAGICQVDVGSSVSEINSTGNIQFQPNPFSAYLNITGIAQTGYLILFDITGKEILRQETTAAQTQISTDAFPSGFYLFNYTINNKTTTGKLLKY